MLVLTVGLGLIVIFSLFKIGVSLVVLLVESVPADQLVQVTVHLVVASLAEWATPTFLVSSLLATLARLRLVERPLASEFSCSFGISEACALIIGGKFSFVSPFQFSRIFEIVLCLFERFH